MHNYRNLKRFTFVSAGFLSVAATLIIGVVASQDDMIYEECYMVESRNECFFYPLNWKTSWNWAQKFCSDHRGRLVSVKSAKVDANA